MDAPEKDHPLSLDDLLSLPSLPASEKLKLAAAVFEASIERALNGDGDERDRIYVELMAVAGFLKAYSAHSLASRVFKQAEGLLNPGGKPRDFWINIARVCIAHKALSEHRKRDEAAKELLNKLPEITRLLGPKDKTPSAKADIKSIIELRRRFDRKRATNVENIQIIYEDGCKLIEDCKGDPAALDVLAMRLLLAVKTSLEA